MESRSSNESQKLENDNSDQSLELEDENKELEKSQEYEILAFPNFSDVKEIAISELHFLCLKNDGRVISYGDNSKLTDTEKWNDIDKIYATNSASYGIKKDGSIVIADKNLYDSWEYQYLWNDISNIVPSYNHMLGLKKDGTVVAVGNNENGQCSVANWCNIKNISASFHSVGLTNDGTVVATGENNFGECNVDRWNNIIQIETGPFYTVGLKADGTVVATGLNSCGQCNISDWSNIKKIYVRGNITAGVSYDGKVFVTGSNSYRFEEVKKWSNIREIKIVNDRIIGIRNDGTIVYKGKPYRGVMEKEWRNIKNLVANSNCVVGLREDNTLICNNILFGLYIPGNENMPLDIKKNNDIGKVVVFNKDKTLDVYNKNNVVMYNWDYSRFFDISYISLSDTHLAGIKADGTAVITGIDVKLAFDVEAWRNLIKLELGSGFCIGLKIDGKVVAAGDNFFGQCDVSWWNEIVDIKVSGLRTFGLKADGTVYFAGLSDYEEEGFVKIFNNIVSIAVNKKQIMLLDSNGNVKVSRHPEGVSRAQIDSWENIKEITSFDDGFIGLKADGTLIDTFEKETELNKCSGIKSIESNDIYVIGRRINYNENTNIG